MYTEVSPIATEYFACFVFDVVLSAYTSTCIRITRLHIWSVSSFKHIVLFGDKVTFMYVCIITILRVHTVPTRTELARNYHLNCTSLSTMFTLRLNSLFLRVFRA